MTFEQAVAHVRAAGAPRVAAYAFVPTIRRGAIAGGAIYAVTFDGETPEGEDPVVVMYMAGTFGSGEGEVEAYYPDDVPDEALDLTYEPSASYDATLPDYDTEIALAVLGGTPLHAALADFEAAGPPQGPNATPEAITADVLIAHGMPATLSTPAGLLPAAVVLLDEDDPRLGMLVDAFGGVVVGEPLAPHAEEGEGTAGVGGVEGEEGPEEVIAEAAWVGLGRGAVLAAVLAVRALPEWADDLPADLAEAWRALLAFATAAIDAPADAEGRRPKPVYQELRRLAAKIDRLVDRQITDHGGLMAFVAGAVGEEIAAGTFVDADFALPSRAELEGPVPLPGARGEEEGNGNPGAEPDDPAAEGGRP